MASPAQLLANRANALKSTGPRTVEGKDASRRNAVKHGLASETLILPDEESDLVAARMLAWGPALDPRDDYECWLVEEVALSSVRIDRCRAVEKAQRNRQARRAAERWDEDRREEAENLGKALHKCPELVQRKLRRTPHGCDWLIARWEALGAAIEAKGDWDDAQKALAIDLLGTPIEFRDLPTLLSGDKAALVRDRIASLETYEEGVLLRLDAMDRAAAEAGIGPVEDRSIVLAKRYEAASIRRMKWAREQLLEGKPRPARPRLVEPPQPAPIPVPAPPRAEIAPPPTPKLVPPAPAPPMIPKSEPVTARSEQDYRRARRAKLARMLDRK